MNHYIFKTSKLEDDWILNIKNMKLNVINKIKKAHTIDINSSLVLALQQNLWF
jgi:hypothetical protein